MNITRKKIALATGGAAVLSVIAVGGASAEAGDDDERERPIPASDIEQAEDAALAETGGGTVTGTEVDDEESKYEVEVTLDDGSEVDVQLDESFAVVGSETEGPDDDSDATDTDD